MSNNRMSVPVFWFTGLSGSGKSTVAEAANTRFTQDGVKVLMLDGDDVRRRLHRDLGFNESDIKTNNSLIAELCEKNRRNYDVIFVPIISPFRSSRAAARRRLSPGFFEIYVQASVNIVRKRDVKGLYSMADRGEIINLIGFSPGSIYEPPTDADLALPTGLKSEQTIIDMFCDFVYEILDQPERSKGPALSDTT